jgi:hypothetical protein
MLAARRALDTLLEPHTICLVWGQVCPTHTKTGPKEPSRSIRLARHATCPCGLWSIVLTNRPMRRHDKFSSAKFVVQELCCRRLPISGPMAVLYLCDGALKYMRGRISIIDREKLEHCACECYAVLQQEKLPLKIGVKL